MMRSLATPNGRLTTGALLVGAGLLDLVTATVSDRVGFALVALGAVYALTGILGRTRDRPA